MLVNTVGNAVVAVIDMRRNVPGLPQWAPISGEVSSGLVLLALVPAVVWFTAKVPMHWNTWRQWLPRWWLASVVFSLLHVFGMVGLRMLLYRGLGEHYDFGPWPPGLFYEYLKDARAFLSFAVSIEVYRFVLLRWQGEVSLLDAPDEGPPVEPVERPERFLVRKLGCKFLIAADDIEWLQSASNYVNLHVRGRDYPLRSTMAAIEHRLDPQRFVRVHRGYIINLSQLASVEPLDGGEAKLYLHDGSVLPCSRRYREALRGKLGGGA